MCSKDTVEFDGDTEKTIYLQFFSNFHKNLKYRREFMQLIKLFSRGGGLYLITFDWTLSFLKDDFSELSFLVDF